MKTAPYDKATLRSRFLNGRRAVSATTRAAASAAISDRVLALADALAARTVAAYVSVGEEPDTTALIAELRRRGVRVIVPVLLPDGDLDWAVHEGPDSLAPGRFGLPQPVGPRLGTAAVGEADLVVVPALAVARDGTRLGRGGGSYDRALARVPAAVRTVALLYGSEVVDELPAEPHDRRVSAAATPDEVLRW